MKLRTGASLCAAVCGLAALSSCTTSTVQPPDTVGVVAAPSEVDTLLPVIADTLPVDNTGTPAPGTLFGGDPCTALVAGDFRSVSIAGSGSVSLTGAAVLGEDACGYQVRAGGTDYVVVVKAVAVDDYDHPVTVAQVIDKFPDLGEEAKGIARGDDLYEVIVHVSNGYFSVSTPDKASALALARVAVDRTLPA